MVDDWGPTTPEALAEEERRRRVEARAAEQVPDSSAFADPVAERKALGARWRLRPFHRATKKKPEGTCPLCEREFLMGEIYRQEKDRVKAHDRCVELLVRGLDPKKPDLLTTEPAPAGEGTAPCPSE